MIIVQYVSDERYLCSHCSTVFTIKLFYDIHMKAKHNGIETTSNGRCGTGTYMVNLENASS